MKKYFTQHIGIFELIFPLIVIFDAIIIHTIPVLRLISNPLIVASLIIYYKLSMESEYERKMVIALFFSLIGDLALMFEHPVFFKIGLLCYSITHFGYAWTTKKMINKLNKNNYLGLGLTSLYYLFAVILILPKTGHFWPFIFCYSFAQYVFCMFTMAQNKSNLLVFGVFIFVISDLLLAGYKFNLLSIKFPILIMITYALAQYLIVKSMSQLNAAIKPQGYF